MGLLLEHRREPAETSPGSERSTSRTEYSSCRPRTDASSGSINPGSLTIGDEYRIQISSRYTSGTSVLVNGNADYDNVVLSATTGNGGGKGNGGDGSGGGKGSGAFSSQRLEELLRGATPGTAAVPNGNKRLLARVKCPPKVGRQCRTTVQGLLREGRPATVKRTVRLRAGKSRLVALQVKPKARKQVAKRKRLLVRQKVRAGKATATVVKTRLLVRR